MTFGVFPFGTQCIFAFETFIFKHQRYVIIIEMNSVDKLTDTGLQTDRRIAIIIALPTLRCTPNNI